MRLSDAEDRAFHAFDVGWRHVVAERLNAIPGLEWQLASEPLLGLTVDGSPDYAFTLRVRPYRYLVTERGGLRSGTALPAIVEQMAAPGGGAVALRCTMRALLAASETGDLAGLAEQAGWATLGLAWWHGLVPPRPGAS